MPFDPESVRANIRQASTEDLLDRITVYRSGMEPAALPIIEKELRRRGVDVERMESHAAECEPSVLYGADGLALSCSFCHRPAVVRRWSWLHLFWETVPLLPWRFRYCAVHHLAPPRGNRPERSY